MTPNMKANAKVKAALVKAGGDQAAAQRLIIAACARDPALLASLTAPFLKGIVSHAIQRAIKDTRPQGKRRTARPRLDSDAMDRVVGMLGQQVGMARSPRGMSALIDPPQPAKAGSEHGDALRQLAASYRRNRPAS
ncbi:MAG: hypothetical protein ACTS3R_01835 [Inquilinaceae bacterium]